MEVNNLVPNLQQITICDCESYPAEQFDPIVYLIISILMVYSPGPSLLKPKQRMANSVMNDVMMAVKPRAE